jgi:predicted nucleic acid-binding protein
MKPTVYIETTIPSYYWDNRPELAADSQRTRVWRDEERADYECFISPVVMEELSTGDYPNKDKCLQLVNGLPLLAATPEIIEVAEVYQTRGLMPRLPVRDALHAAIASCYRMDYLLTWNCRHLANANKTPHVERLNQKMGLHVPLLVTPDLLRPWEDES